MNREDLLKLGFKNNEGSCYYELNKEGEPKDWNFNKVIPYVRIGIHLASPNSYFCGKISIKSGYKDISNGRKIHKVATYERVCAWLENDDELMFYLKHFKVI